MTFRPRLSDPQTARDVAFCAPYVAPLKEQRAVQGSAGRGDDTQIVPDLSGNISLLRPGPVAHGAFGDVYEAVWSRDSNASEVKVAVKTLRPPTMEEVQEKGKMFRRELRVWKKLDHENILPLYGLATGIGHGGFPAMVCPWAEQKNLNAYLKSAKGAALTALERFCILKDISAGLQYLHSCSIVHGDLNGPNILIDADGRAMLADFGLSTVFMEFGSHNVSSAKSGALRWTAPELIHTSGSGASTLPTPQADVYSFGSVMLQVLTGNAPYHYIMSEQALAGEIHQGIKPKRPTNAEVSDAQWDFIERCWATERGGADRPTIQEVCEFVARQADMLRGRTVICVSLPGLEQAEAGCKPLVREGGAAVGKAYPSLAAAKEGTLSPQFVSTVLDSLMQDLSAKFQNLVDEVRRWSEARTTYAKVNDLYVCIAEDVTLIGTALRMVGRESSDLTPYTQRLGAVLEQCLLDAEQDRVRAYTALAAQLECIFAPLITVLRAAFPPPLQTRVAAYVDVLDGAVAALAAASKAAWQPCTVVPFAKPTPIRTSTMPAPVASRPGLGGMAQEDGAVSAYPRRQTATGTGNAGLPLYTEPGAGINDGPLSATPDFARHACSPPRSPHQQQQQQQNGNHRGDQSSGDSHLAYLRGSTQNRTSSSSSSPHGHTRHPSSSSASRW
ncbi:kinase-like protein [Coniophora puteana RWD-64-598 SS2]|uniref:Kinase-like protein n=1 Tax=Coniophora puteana (strain RWD-64-598) TaxID=741705 RepID=A0A5M3MZL5_CONPW|nr:kinase-like protein [Coniophora puteana RWD-64-598 SS2]EIW84071.1 kinase-like protein [Coniophora puteana RWD-64-598 SS2]